MTVDLDLPKDRLQLAGLVDHKGASFDAPIFSAVHIFLFITAVSFRNSSLFITQQREWQVEFLDELLVRLFAVQAHTKNDRPRLLDRRAGIAKVARFLGTARSIIFGIKLEDDVFTRKVFQTDRFSRLVGKRQGRSLVTNYKFV